jgi:LacI family transcriptional regulator
VKKSKAKKRIALAYPLAVPHLALFTQGVSDYAREHGGWTFVASPTVNTSFSETLSMMLESLKDCRGDGVIAVMTTPDQEQSILELGIPVVNLSGAFRESKLPRAMVDHRAVGRLAAEHLLECGLKRFAYYGANDVWFAVQRRWGFVERIEEAGYRCEVLEVERRADAKQLWSRATQGVEKWLLKLVPPVGIMAMHDYFARVLIDECDSLGLKVPNDVALIGADNDEIICKFSHPPLSSVSRSGRRVGYAAALLLDQLMAGEPVPQEDVLVPPDRVVRRLSTDVLDFADPNVTTCARYVRDHADEVFGVGRLAKLVPVSRSLLERRFKQCTGHTLHEYILRQRVERAKLLLTGRTEMGLERIAAASGFSDVRALRRAFTRIVGMAPIAYRRSQQPHQMELGHPHGTHRKWVV